MKRKRFSVAQIVAGLRRGLYLQTANTSCSHHEASWICPQACGRTHLIQPRRQSERAVLRHAEPMDRKQRCTKRSAEMG